MNNQYTNQAQPREQQVLFMHNMSNPFIPKVSSVICTKANTTLKNLDMDSVLFTWILCFDMCKAAEWQYYESACPDDMYMHALAVLIEAYVVTKFSPWTQHILLFIIWMASNI